MSVTPHNELVTVGGFQPLHNGGSVGRAIISGFGAIKNTNMNILFEFCLGVGERNQAERIMPSLAVSVAMAVA